MPVVNSDMLKKLHLELKAQNSGVIENEKYVRGLNPYILGKPAKKKPDNRIPDPLGKVVVETVTGYAGRAGDKKTDYDLVSTKTKKDSDDFIKYMRVMDAYNKVDLENSELYEEANVQGKSYELWWVSDKLEINGKMTAEFKIVPNTEIVLKFNSSIKPELQFFVHFVEADKTIIADVYYALFKETWTKKINDDVWVKQNKVTKYPYTTPPLNLFRSNRRAEPLFQAEKPLIDAIDKIISKSVNEVDRFNDVILLLGRKIESIFAGEIQDGNVGIIDELTGEDNLAKYLEKNLGGVKDFYNELLDRLVREVHKSSKVPDMTSQAFTGGDQSGKALMIKLTELEFKAASIDVYFDQGLDMRLKFYGDVYNAVKKKIDITDYKAVITSKRNIPVDVKDRVESFQKLGSEVSKKTKLEFLGNEIVPDVEKELERLKEEQPKNTIDFDDPEENKTGE